MEMRKDLFGRRHGLHNLLIIHDHSVVGGQVASLDSFRADDLALAVERVAGSIHRLDTHVFVHGMLRAGAGFTDASPQHAHIHLDGHQPTSQT